MKYIMETRNLTKKYGSQYGVRDVNIHLEKGEVYGLVGRNGAGKTTILRMLSGLSNPTAGTFLVLGQEGINNPVTRSKIGCLIENPGIYSNMTAAENLKLKCIALGVKDFSIVKELLEKVGLEKARSKKTGKFSLGMKQRLGIAMALIGNPDIVILDEPINGLDPQGIVEVRETIEKLNKENGITFIISSHLLDELSKVANKYGIIHGGELLEEFTSRELEEKCSKRVELHINDVNHSARILEDIGIKNYRVIDNSHINIFEHMDQTGKITKELCKADIEVIEIIIKNETLEDFYLSMTGGKANA